jgi:hypothetical protein
MRKLIWLLVPTILWFGCKSKIPSNIIEPDKMQKILYDIHVADGYISTINLPDSARKVAAAYYKGIYKKFDVDSVKYNRSMNYYYAHPNDLDKIYKGISKTLEKQKKTMEKVDSLRVVKKAKADSLLQSKALKADSIKKSKKDSLSSKKSKQTINNSAKTNLKRL